jgi:hypothetical protein
VIVVTANQSDGYAEHSFSYVFQGSEWAVTVPARSETEARERLARAAAGLYDGVIVGTYPVAFGWWAMVRCWWANLGRSVSQLVTGCARSIPAWGP